MIDPIKLLLFIVLSAVAVVTSIHAWRTLFRVYEAHEDVRTISAVMAGDLDITTIDKAF